MAPLYLGLRGLVRSTLRTRPGEFAELLDAAMPAERRAELVQVAAVAVQWIEAIDRRCSR